MADGNNQVVKVQERVLKPLTVNELGFRTNLNFNFRELLARVWGFGGNRDLYKVFGWDRMITVAMMAQRYNRGGIAARVINAYPDAIWARPPLLYDDVNGPQDPWTNKWESLSKSCNLWEALWRADKLSRLGRYAVVLVGTDKANLESELKNAQEITYLQPYGELAAEIIEYESNASNPRFGLPKMYRISPDLGADPRTVSGASKAPATRGSFRVHHSRIIHIAHGILEDEVYGIPQLGPIWNYLTDLDKVVGGSAESYWLTANRGLQLNVDKDLQLSEEDAAALSQEADEYTDQLRRVIRTRGVDAKDLGSRVADPKGPYTVLVQLISGTVGIPMRILLGAEAGHLASTQDKGNWAEQVENHRMLVSEPRIMKPVLECFINGGLLSEPTTDVWTEWPDAFRPTPLERGEIASKTALAANNLGLAAKNQPNLLSGSEQRAIIGFASDNRLLEDVPMTADDHVKQGKRDSDVMEPPQMGPLGGAGEKGGQPGGQGSGGPAQAVGTPKANEANGFVTLKAYSQHMRKKRKENKNSRPIYTRRKR